MSSGFLCFCLSLWLKNSNEHMLPWISFSWKKKNIVNSTVYILITKISHGNGNSNFYFQFNDKSKTHDYVENRIKYYSCWRHFSFDRFCSNYCVTMMTIVSIEIEFNQLKACDKLLSKSKSIEIWFDWNSLSFNEWQTWKTALQFTIHKTINKTDLLKWILLNRGESIAHNRVCIEWQ